MYTYIEKKIQNLYRYTFLCRLRSIVTHRDHFVHIWITLSVVCLSVLLSVRLSICHIRIAMFRRRHMHSSECCHYFNFFSVQSQVEYQFINRNITFFNSIKTGYQKIMIELPKGPVHIWAYICLKYYFYMNVYLISYRKSSKK